METALAKWKMGGEGGSLFFKDWVPEDKTESATGRDYEKVLL